MPNRMFRTSINTRVPFSSEVEPAVTAGIFYVKSLARKGLRPLPEILGLR